MAKGGGNFEFDVNVLINAITQMAEKEVEDFKKEAETPIEIPVKVDMGDIKKAKKQLRDLTKEMAKVERRKNDAFGKNEKDYNRELSNYNELVSRQQELKNTLVGYGVKAKDISRIIRDAKKSIDGLGGQKAIDKTTKEKTRAVKKLGDEAEKTSKKVKSLKDTSETEAGISPIKEQEKSIESVGNAAESVAKSVAKSQEKIRQEIKDTNRSIANQKDWISYLDPVLNKDNFKTKGKREATEQLRRATAQYTDYWQNKEERDNVSSYAKEIVNVRWMHAFQEAQRQGVAQSSLNRYSSALNSGLISFEKIYTQSLNNLQEEYDYRTKRLSETQEDLDKLTAQLNNTIKMPTLYDTPTNQLAMFDGMIESAHQAESAVESLGDAIQEVAKIPGQISFDDIINASEKAKENYVYHAGVLGKRDKTMKSYVLGNTPPGKKDDVFNGFTGLYTTENLEEFIGNEWDGAPISTIDLSKYKMFDARNGEVAERLKNFFNNFNGVIYGYLDTYDFETMKPTKLTEFPSLEELYVEYQKLFGNAAIPFNDFVAKIKEYQSIVKDGKFVEFDAPDIDHGIAKSGAHSALQGVLAEVFNSDNFQTMLLKASGFEGVDLRGTKYNGTYTGGTVVFDVKEDSLVAVDEMYSDVLKGVLTKLGMALDADDLLYEKKRREIAFATADAYSDPERNFREMQFLPNSALEQEKEIRQIKEHTAAVEADTKAKRENSQVDVADGSIAENTKQHNAHTAALEENTKAQQRNEEAAVRKNLTSTEHAAVFDGGLDQLLSSLNITGDAAQNIIKQFNDVMTLSKANVYDESVDNFGIINDTLNNIIKDISASAVRVTDIEDDAIRQFYDHMKNVQIQYTDADRSEFGSDWAAIKKRNSKVLTTKSTGIGADVLYDELLGLFPSLFDGSIINPADQLKSILNQLNRARELKKNNFKITAGLSSAEQDGIVESVSGLYANGEIVLTRIKTEQQQILETEQKIADAVNGTNDVRQDGVDLTKKMQEQGDDGQEPLDGKKELVDIKNRDEEEARKTLREAAKNITSVIDLSKIETAEQLKAELESAADKIYGDPNLEFANVRINGPLADFTLKNKARGTSLGLHYENTAEGLQLKHEDYRHNAEAERAYADAQKKQIEDSKKWANTQLKVLDRIDRERTYSAKKIEGTTTLKNVDETTLSADADKTVDSLSTHIRDRLNSAMGGLISKETQNSILQDIRVLENEVKVDQLEKYATTTLKPSELEEARKTFEYALDMQESKARKGNVFTQMEEDFSSLRKQLTDPEAEGYIKDAVGLSEFSDKFKTTKSKLTAELAGAQEVKNLITLQDKLYNLKKRQADLDADSYDGMRASRLTAEAQAQYDTAVAGLKVDEQRNQILERQGRLEAELDQYTKEKTKKQDDADNKKSEEANAKSINDYYQNILNNIKEINKIDTQINNLKFKDGGTGFYAGQIAQLEADKDKYKNRLSEIGAEIQQEFNGIFEFGKDAGLSFDGLDSASTFTDFFNDARVQATLTTEQIDRLAQSLKLANEIELNFGIKLAEQGQKVEEAKKAIDSISDPTNSILDKNSDAYKNAIGQYEEYHKLIYNLTHYMDEAGNIQVKDVGQISAKDIALIKQATDETVRYMEAVRKAAEQEAKAFTGQTKYNKGMTMDNDGGPKDLIVTDDAQQNLRNARAELEKFVADYTKGEGVVTDFVTAANGISEIKFSVFDEATNSLRTFSAATGQFTKDIYFTESSVDKISKAIKEAGQVGGSIQSLMDRFSGVNGAEGHVKTLLGLLEQLRIAMNSAQASGDSSPLNDKIQKTRKALLEYQKLAKDWEKAEAALMSGDADILGTVDKNASVDTYKQMFDMIKGGANGAKVAVQDFDSTTNTLRYTLTNADGVVTEMTAHMHGLNGVVTTQQSNVRKLNTVWGDLKNASSGLWTDLKQYVRNTIDVMGAVQALRSGFNAVKEIDAALTELKKVTDETESSYKNFLNTASQSAGKIGSTVSDFTTATANFARLGYTMDESANMAEAAIVYKNVADGLDTVEESTDSIISTMKAFGIESDDVMGIVDRFNEVGNNFAITSAGIGDALQRSASALYESGNTIDESIALVTAANSVIQNPEQVGE